MGILAAYYALTAETYQELESSAQGYRLDWDDIEELIEEELEESLPDDAILDIDKMWDLAHFILTGQGVTPEQLPELDGCHLSIGSQVVLGIRYCSEDPLIGLSGPGDVQRLSTYLQGLPLEQLIDERFDMTVCQKAGLYPDIWAYDEEYEEIKDILS